MGAEPERFDVHRDSQQRRIPAGDSRDEWRLLGLGVALAVTACGPSESPAPDAAAAAERQTAYRVRSDLDAGLNVDTAWASGLNERATVRTEHPFRLRFELERSTDASAERRFRLQYRRNGGEWMNVQAAAFPYSEQRELTPRTSIISTSAYSHGAATTNVLDGSSAEFAGGAGVVFTDLAPSFPLEAGQSEWEWPLVIRRYADGPVTNEDGDRFEYRMVDAEGRTVDADVVAEVEVSVPPRLLGGTFVETPGRVGPWQNSNGDLFFIMEPAESDNVLMVVKSSDGGATWHEVDGMNRPGTGDLEGLGSDFAGGTIHILHQISDAVLYHAFRTADAADGPEGWVVRDERVAAPPGEPPVQVASLTARSDGSLVAVYGGPEKIRYRIRSRAGEWGAETVVDADTQPRLSGPQTVLGADDTVHLAYTARDGTAWYRRIDPDGALSPRERIASGLDEVESDIGSILPLVFVPETNTVVVIYRRPSGEFWSRRIVEAGAPSDPVQVTERHVVQNAVDSDQVGADAIAYGTDVHVLFIEQGSGSIYHTRTDDQGAWQVPTLEVDGIRGQWIRGWPVTLDDGTDAYGYVYDAGSDGGSGRNWFGRVKLGER